MKQAEQSEFPNYESSTLPYVCWYQNDFLGGVRGMRAHEIGIYTILLNEIYARGRPLDLSEERLARLCGCDKRTFTSVLEMLIAEGKILNLTCGLWNKRCENVFRERAQLLEQKSSAGRSSAQKRKKINAKIQHLLNTYPTDDELNSKAQKEEKETPNGVSQKKNVCSDTKPHSTKHLLKQPHSTKHPAEHPTEQTASCPSSTHSSITRSSSTPLSSTEHCPTEHLPTELLVPDLATTYPETPPHSTKHPAEHPTEQTVLRPSSAHSSTTRSSSTLLSSTEHSSSAKSLKGHRLPANWVGDIHAAISEGLSEEQARWQEKKFRDYWHAKSGKQALKVDWSATWRNWYRREIERLRENQERLCALSSGSNTRPHSTQEDALYRNLINYQAK
ncbi:YdaU family protein [Bartonella schoenbuchensis]|uniref:Phage related protein n=1 Tax=Bartonella schoenbuchensis m07a TaxID=1094496 RepID=N6UK80_9HYPH|nr:DUF1376 domain-containing protein [Bartonella schoenbuchensis]ENN90613.1 phage related protein [Bartonella schoenbuchensis m07a]